MKYVFLLILTLIVSGSFAQEKFLDLRKLEELQKVEPRPVIILISTEWCKMCFAMKNSLLKNKQITQAIEGVYYLINLDAGKKEDLMFNGKVYRFNSSGKHAGVHELAIEWGMVNGQISFPTLLILTSDGQVIYRYSGYLDTAQLMAVISAL